MGKHVVAPLADMPPGSRKLVIIDGRAVAVFNISGEFFALVDRCPHKGGSLVAGSLTGLVQSSAPGNYSFSRPGEILRCPWHGWEFDIRTGKSRCEPERIMARAFQVGVEAGSAISEGPYEVETFAVSVEQDYVVVMA